MRPPGRKVIDMMRRTHDHRVELLLGHHGKESLLAFAGLVDVEHGDNLLMRERPGHAETRCLDSLAQLCAGVPARHGLEARATVALSNVFRNPMLRELNSLTITSTDSKEDRL